MIHGEKIGVGIVTCGRVKQFTKLFESLIPCRGIIDNLAVVEDTIGSNPTYANYIDEVTRDKWKDDGTLKKLFSDENMGVAVSKNYALKILLEAGCEHIFLIEDDIFVKNVFVFQEYIAASKVSGIQHFNFSQHGKMNKTFDGYSDPNPNIIIGYGMDKRNINIPLYPHCVGAFSYYSKAALEKVGLMDTAFYNACEHVDHTYSIIKAGMHPPFWNFADIENSWEYLGDEEWSLKQSTISSKPDHRKIVQGADAAFVKKHGHLPLQIPIAHQDEIGKSLREIKKTYGYRDSES